MVCVLAHPTRPEAGPGFQVKVLNGRASAEDPLYTPREVFPTPPRPRSIFTQELNRCFFWPKRSLRDLHVPGGTRTPQHCD
jgi:hypothetical protein